MTWIPLVTMLILTSGQAGSQAFTGTWTAERDGQTYVRLELRVNDGALGGRIALGNIEVDAQGEVRSALAAPKELTPLFDLVLREATLSFARKDGDDTDQFELTLVGDQAELRFIPTEADRLELAAIGVPVPKPVRLKRITP